MNIYSLSTLHYLLIYSAQNSGYTGNSSKQEKKNDLTKLIMSAMAGRNKNKQLKYNVTSNLTETTLFPEDNTGSAFKLWKE